MMLMVGALAMLAATTSCSSSSKAPRKPQTDMVEQVLRSAVPSIAAMPTIIVPCRAV